MSEPLKRQKLNVSVRVPIKVPSRMETHMFTTRVAI